MGSINPNDNFAYKILNQHAPMPGKHRTLTGGPAIDAKEAEIS
jgi:hypothetical protein